MSPKASSGIKKAIALSAGLGTRLRPATLTKPKPLIPFLGVPLILHSIERLKSLGIDEVGINTHYLADVLQSEVEKMQLGVKTHFHFESELMGTAGALYGFKEWLKDSASFVLCNSDEVFFVNPEELRKAQDHHLHSRNLATLLVCENPLVGQAYGGIWTEARQSEVRHPVAQSVKTIQKKSVEGLIGWHYLGWSFLSSKVLDLLPLKAQPCDILYDILLKQLPSEAVQVFPVDAKWFDAGDTAKFEESQKKARELLLSDSKVRSWQPGLKLS